MPVLSLIFYMSNHHHRFALAGIEYPRVMKSTWFSAIPFFDENRLLRLWFDSIFRLLLRSSCSARTLAVNAAVPPLLMLQVAASPLTWFFAIITSSSIRSETRDPAVAMIFFLFLLPPKAFNECARPCSLRLCARFSRRSLSIYKKGRIGITLFGA